MGIVLNDLHWNTFFRLCSVAEFFFERALTELHYCVLDYTLFLVNRVKEVKDLDDVGAATHQGEDLILTRDHISNLHGTFESDTLSRVLVDGFKYVTYRELAFGLKTYQKHHDL